MIYSSYLPKMSVQYSTDFHNLDLIESGDIIIFRSPINRNSLSIVLGTRSNWTHVGVAVWVSEDGNRRLFIFDAHASVGVRKIAFDVMARRYDSIYIRKIPYVRDDSIFPDILKSFIDEYTNKPYISYIRVPLIPYLPFSDEGVSCGELAARWMNVLGILTPTKSLVNYIPGDFVKGVIDFQGNDLRILYHATHFDSPTLMYIAIAVILITSVFLISTLIDIYNLNK